MYLSVQFSCSIFVTPWTAAHQASLSITNSYSLLKLNPLSWWSHTTISSSVVPFSSWGLQSFPASGSFQMIQFFASGSQRDGVSVSASVLPMNTQDWFPLGWTGWISLQSKGQSRVFSNTTVQKYQFFCTQLSFFSLCPSFFNEMLNCTSIKYYVCFITKHSLRAKHLSSKIGQG